MKIKNKFENNDINNNKINISNNNPFKKDIIFYCKVHNITFLDQISYERHFKSRHKFDCLKYGNIFSSIIKVEKHFKECFKIDNDKNEKNNFSYYECYRDSKKFPNEKTILSILKNIITMISHFIVTNAAKDFFSKCL